MSLDSDQLKEELDRLKTKYRKEALRAVAVAREEAYNRGKTEGKAESERELSQWKAIARTFETNIEDKSKPAHLLQHIVEHVYRDIKLDHAQANEITLSSIKASILSSTHKMMATMPDIVLRRNTPAVTVETAAIDLATQNINNTENVSKTQVPASSFLLDSNNNEVTSLLYTCSSPKHFVGIKVESTSGNIVKGVFIDGQFVSYTLNVTVHNLDLQTASKTQEHRADCARFPSYRLETRTSDLRNMHHILLKEHPWVAIPPVPNKNYKITATAKSPQRHKKQETKTQYRRRAFECWLQFLVNLEPLQTDPALLMFLTGKSQSLSAGSETAQSRSTDTVDSSSNLILYTRTFSERRAREKEPEGIILKRNMKAFLESAAASGAVGVDNDEGWTDASFAQLMPSRYLTKEECSENTSVGHFQLFSLQASAYQDLRKVERELGLVEYSSKSAIATCKELVECWCDYATELRDLCASITAWGALEPLQSLEHATLFAISAVSEQANTTAGRIGETLQCSLFEPTEFLQDTCVQSARELVDTARKHPAIRSVVPDHPYYSLSTQSAANCDQSRDGAEFPSTKGRLNDISAIRKLRDGLAGAVAATQAWDNSKRVRGAMMVSQMLSLAKSMAQEHSDARIAWESALKEISKINVTTGTTETADALYGGVDTSMPALESSTTLLRTAIQDELLNFESSHGASEEERRSLFRPSAEWPSPCEPPETESKSSYAPDYPGSGDADENPKVDLSCSSSGVVTKRPSKLVGLLPALKSFKAIFHRAKVPFGIRKAPSVSRIAPPVLPSEEDTIAAMYNAKMDAASNQSLLGDGSAEKRVDTLHESTASALLQQDQRQHRLAARRQATAQGGTMHTTNKIKTSASVSAMAQPISGEVFGAAPQPAVAKQTHAVFKDKSGQELRPSPVTLPPDMPSPAYPESSKGKSLTEEGKASAPQFHHSDSSTAKSNPIQRMEAKPETAEKQHTPQSSLSKASTIPQPQQSVSSLAASAPQHRASSLSPPSMPSGWIEVQTENGEVYYYHSVTRVSRWDRPSEVVSAALEARIRQANVQVDEAVQKRKEERQREEQLQEERDHEAENLRGKVMATVQKWAYDRPITGNKQQQTMGAPPSAPLLKDLVLLLSSMHTILAYIPDSAAVLNPVSLPQPLTTATCPPAELKKAYMRAVRFVHPDKLPDGLDLESQLLAEAVFIILTEAYNKYRSACH